MNSFWRMVECPRRAVWVLVLLAALVRVVNVAFLVDSPLFLAPTSDEAEHFELASRIAERGDWLGREEGLMMRPPLFAWVLAGLFGVFGADYMLVHGLVLLCDVVSVGLWYLVAVRCMGRGAAFVAGVGMAVYWGFVHFSSTGYMESFALALNGGLVLCVVGFFRRELGIGASRAPSGLNFFRGRVTQGCVASLLTLGYHMLPRWGFVSLRRKWMGGNVGAAGRELGIEGLVGEDEGAALPQARNKFHGTRRLEQVGGEDGVRSARSESGAGSPQSRRSVCSEEEIEGLRGEDEGAALPQARNKFHDTRLLEQVAGEARAVPGGGRGWWLLVVGGLLAGLGVLTRPTLLIVMPWLGLMVAYAAMQSGRVQLGAPRKWLRGIAAGVVLALFTVVGMSPNALRHWFLFGEWVPLGINGEINFHMANNDDGWGWWVNSPGLEYDIYRDTPTVIGGRPLTVEGARAYWMEENREFVWEKPGEFLRGLGLKWLQVWNGYEIHVINDFREHWRLSPVERWALPSWVVIGFGFAGLVMAVGAAARQLLRQLLITNYRLRIEGSLRDEEGTASPLARNKFHDTRRLERLAGDDNGELGAAERARGLGRLLLAGWVVFYMVGVALYHVNSRHRLPAMPGLVLLGAWAGAVAVAAARQLLITNYKLRIVGSLRDEDGVRSAQSGSVAGSRGARAWGWFWGRGGVFVLVLVGFGLAWLPVIPDWMGRHEVWWTHVNKGVALAKLDRAEEAVAEFERATVVRPDKLEGWRQLALARESVGDFAGAVGAQGELLGLLEAQYPEYPATRAEQLEVAVRLDLAAGDVAGAARDARALLGLAPGHFRAYVTAAKVARAEGNTSAAVELEARAEELRGR